MRSAPQGGEPTADDIEFAPIVSPNADGGLSVEGVAVLQSRFVQISRELAEAREEIAALERRDRTAKILDDLIKPYARATFIFMCLYCGTVALILILQATGTFTNPLSSGVLQFLVGSTATTIIGLVGMVLTGIFVGARPRS